MPRDREDGMTWKELFGTNGKDVPAPQRKANWEAFLATASPEVREYWDSAEGCEGCIHREQAAFQWCALQALPCSTNPILTFGSGMVGMACMGAGKEIRQEVTQEVLL